MTFLYAIPKVTVLADPRPDARRLMPAHAVPDPDQPKLPPSRGLEEPTMRVLSRVPPEDRQVLVSITTAVVEILQGRRPVHQMDMWAHPDVVAAIGRLQRAGRDSPLHFRSARMQMASSNAVEVSIHLVADGKSKAVALRLVRGRAAGHWICHRFETALWSAAVTKAG